MSHVFISYARSTAKEAQAVAAGLRGLGHEVWLDDAIPAHRAYADVIEERLREAKAVVVIWSADAAKSEWVRSEADRARADRKLVQVKVDGAALPMPFDQIQFADMTGWTGDLGAPGWRKVADSVGALTGGSAVTAAPASQGLLPLPNKPSIAIMPFANLSGDPEQEYFADGMVVEIVEALSRFRSIFVIASGSSLSFKGKGVGAQEAARQLGVRYVLEGSVRKAGNRVRIGVQLIDAVDGLPVWTERFEDTLQDIFDLQDKVALAIVGRIEPTVETAEIKRASARPTADLRGYDLYLRALPPYGTLRKEGVLAALDLLDRATALDPANGPALAMAAFGHWLVVAFGWSDDPVPHRQQAQDLARRAVTAAGDDANVLALAGYVLGYDDRSAGLALVGRAMVLNPGSSTVWTYSGLANLAAGRLDLATLQLETSLRMDPISVTRPARLGNLGRALLLQSRFAGALPLLREAAEVAESPTFVVYRAACLGHLGLIDEAKAALERARTLTPLGVEAMLREIVLDPDQRKLILDGIALAEGTDSSDTPGGAT